MERILWLDGHVSSISAEEAFSNTWCLPSCYGCITMLFYNGFEFEWHNNMWMQI